MKETEIKNIKYITIIATHNCNLNCSYCYEQHKSTEKMDVDLVKKIIQNELNIDDNFDLVAIDFFGGEPFLEFDSIINIIDFVKAQKHKKEFSFFAGTNGTILSEKYKQWLVDNKNIFSLALSLDGTKTMQDINRSNSFDLIDIDFFVNKFSNVTVKMTISQDTLEYLAEGVEFLHKSGFQFINCNLAMGVDWLNENNSFTLENELEKLINFYLENPLLAPCSLLNYNIQNIAYYSKKIAHKYCGAGTRMKIYDIDGKVYPCQYFMPLAIGEKSLATENIVFSDIIKSSDLDTMCQKCIVVDICPSCYGSNFAGTGNIYGRDPAFCKLSKIIIKANSYFKAKQWELGLLSLDEYQEQELLKGIMMIQEQL